MVLSLGSEVLILAYPLWLFQPVSGPVLLEFSGPVFLAIEGGLSID
jgi:hypothetical protein